jgi:hypothetical protein
MYKNKFSNKFVTFSSGRSGLWSIVILSAMQLSVGPLYPITVLESPIFAHTQRLRRITAQVKVVPEKSVSIEDSTITRCMKDIIIKELSQNYGADAS